MPKWLKVVLGLLAALVLVCALGAGALAWWAHANEAEFREVNKEAMAEGKGWATQFDAAGCVEMALRQNDREGGLLKEAAQTIALQTCLQHAARPAGFCDGVPTRDALSQSVTWAMAKCVALGRPNQAPCTRMVKKVQEVCGQPPPGF